MKIDQPCPYKLIQKVKYSNRFFKGSKINLNK